MSITSLDHPVVLKKLLSDPETLKVFIKDLMGIVLQPTLIETEKKFRSPRGNIELEIDIFVEDLTQRLVIGIQQERDNDDPARFWRDHQLTVIEVAKRYHSHKLNCTVCTIVWLTRQRREPRYQRSLITTYPCSETETSEQLTIYPHRLYLLNPFYCNDQTPARLADWLKLVTECIVHPNHPNVNMKRQFMPRAIELIANENLTPREFARLLDDVEYDRRLRAVREEALQEAKALPEKATARNLLAEGLEPALIAEITGLTIEEVTAT